MIPLCSNDIPIATPEHFPEQVLSWMDDFKIAHIPYFVDGEYSMLLTENQLFDYEPMLPLGQQVNHLVFAPYCTENQHLWEIIPIFSKNRLSLLPLLSDEKKYLGVLLASDLFFAMGSSFYTANNVIIKLEVAQRDYTLTQIAQIVESDDAKIVRLSTELEPDSERLSITIQLHGDRLQGVIQSFIRHGYNVEAIYGQQNDDPTGMKDRYDSLMNYLSI